jgi:DNA-binding MarR family transcriptional regulator
MEDKIQKIKQLSRQYSDMSILMHEAIARKAGLSGTDHKYLGLLIQKGQMTAGEFSGVTGLTTGAVTGLIDRLEKKELVKRQFSKEDRRKVIIEPNSKNIIAILEPLFSELQERSQQLIASFAESEIETLERYFSQAIRIMEETKDRLNSK